MVGAYTVAISSSLIGGIADITALEEDAADTLIVDGVAANYLLGLDRRGRVLIMQVEADGGGRGGNGGAPTAYAVLRSTVDWNGADEDDLGGAGFGSGYTYYGGGSARVFFTANSGAGIFELSLPIDVDASCWNYGTAAADHAECASSTTVLTYRAPSVFTNYNDGLNCPEADVAIAETLAPTPGPTPSPAPSTAAPTELADRWDDPEVRPFDCENHPAPLQVLKPKDDAGNDLAHYELRELDLATGAYDTIFKLDYLADHEYFDDDAFVNGAAMLDAGASGSFVVVAIDCRLCRVDGPSEGRAAGRAQCHDEVLSRMPDAEADRPWCATVGATVGTTYYYGDRVGDGGSLYYVENVHTDDAAVFHDAYALPDLGGGLLSSDVADVAALQEGGADDLVVDGVAGTYLVGLDKRGNVLVVRVDTDDRGNGGAPVAYAVVRADVDWNGRAPTDIGAFGSAYAYYDRGGARRLDDLRAAPAAPGARAFFTANKGAGIFELALPLAIPEECWMDATPAAAAACDERATLTYRAPSVSTSKNDGLNCPDADVAIPATLAPTPAPSPAPTLAPTACRLELATVGEADDAFFCFANVACAITWDYVGPRARIKSSTRLQCARIRMVRHAHVRRASRTR